MVKKLLAEPFVVDFKSKKTTFLKNLENRRLELKNSYPRRPPLCGVVTTENRLTS